MAISEGTYLIINANSKLAMDVANASDAWGANILLWSAHGGDSQIWAVTHHDNGWQLICSLTGKSADVENGKVDVDGTNVRQWEDNNANCQRWDFVETGETESYDGNSYETYAIKAHGTNRCLDAANGGTAPGTNVLLYTYNSQRWQKWFLVPVSCFTAEGTYAIRSALDTNLCVDIANGSNGAGAKAVVWPYHGYNNEVFQTVRNADSLTVKIVAAHSGKVLDVDHGATENGRQVLQWPSEDGNANQEWLPVQSGSITVNGATVPTYALRNQSTPEGQSRVIDICGGSKTPGTNLIVWEWNNTQNQRFWFEKTEMTGDGISTPSQAQPQMVQVDGPGTLRLSFDCDEELYQARYRVRTYGSKDRQKFSQTEWMNVRDGSKTNEGWGPAWTYGFTRSELESDGTLTLPRDFEYDVDGASDGKAYMEIDLQVRAYRESYGTLGAHAHGPTASTTVRVAKNPNVGLGELFVRTVTTNGSEDIAIEARLTHDVPLAKSHHVSGRLVDADGKYISEIVTVDESNSDAVSLVFPTSVMRSLPDDGEQVGIEYGWQTSDGGYASGTLSGEVDYNIQSGLEFNERSDRHDDDTWTDYLTIDAHAKDWCWLAIERGSGVEMFECPTILSDSGTKTFKVLPPLNRPYRLILLAREGSRFALKTVTMPAFEAHVHTWSWGERFDETANLHVSEGSRPKQTRGYESDSAVHVTTGRRHPVAWAHRTVSIDLSVEGSTYVNDDVRYSQDEDFERLSYVIGQGHHPVYRNPRGDWYRVIVKAVDNSYQEEWGSGVKVSQEAVTV